MRIVTVYHAGCCLRDFRTMNVVGSWLDRFARTMIDEKISLASLSHGDRQTDFHRQFSSPLLSALTCDLSIISSFWCRCRPSLWHNARDEVHKWHSGNIIADFLYYVAVQILNSWRRKSCRYVSVAIVHDHSRKKQWENVSHLGNKIIRRKRLWKRSTSEKDV